MAQAIAADVILLNKGLAICAARRSLALQSPSGNGPKRRSKTGFSRKAIMRMTDPGTPHADGSLSVSFEWGHAVGVRPYIYNFM